MGPPAASADDHRAAGAAAPRDDARVLQIDAVLPQTQCRQCGYGGCLPYARALAGGSAAINRCPPGGDAGVAALAALLERPVIALDPACGSPRPLHVARIDEARCIGCTLCIQACPVDAIAGAIKRMHTVVSADCTGCDLCLPPCPMDCIEMVPVDPPRAWTPVDAARARARLHARDARIVRERDENDARLAGKARRKLAQLQAHDTQAPGALAVAELPAEVFRAHQDISHRRPFRRQCAPRDRPLTRRSRCA